MMQFVWLTLLAVHTAAAAVWWWMMPHGFPSSATEFWINEVAPLFVIAILLTALIARGRVSETILPPILAAIPVFWMACAISSRLVFGDSFQSLWHVPFVASAVLAGLWLQRFHARLRPLLLVPIVLVAAVAGWSFPDTQRAPDPLTAPAGAALGDVPAATRDHKLIKLTKDAQLQPADGRVVLRRDTLVLNVQPMLSFSNRSPDRCWTALAPDEQNHATTRTLVAKVHDGARWRLFYKDEDASVLEVTTANNAVMLDARSRLATPIFSHVNDYAELMVQGHHKLSVSFSPVPKERIAVAAQTEPLRFAYVDAAGTFHVMQASALHRGPFTELASGPLKRGEPVVLTLYDSDKAMFSVSLDDWAAQASTQLSPAAGWGVPVNAIELVRGGDLETSPVLITFSLADTSVGRSTQSVGHAPGVYRDRMTITLPQ